jgi:hypothetical protein
MSDTTNVDVDVALQWVIDPSSAVPSGNVFQEVTPPGLQPEQIPQYFAEQTLAVVPFAGFVLTQTRARELGTLLIESADRMQQSKGNSDG